MSCERCRPSRLRNWYEWRRDSSFRRARSSSKPSSEMFCFGGWHFQESRIFAMPTIPQPPVLPAAARKLLAALEKNWQAEKAGYHTYETLASRERNPVRKEKLHDLAQAEQHHAELWEQRIQELGGPKPK